ncbi:MAG: hypothetical protein GF393_03235 [Armatimonadia bacterium]|nr:hypothetical protein [Armatimonadia bacterium]
MGKPHANCQRWMWIELIGFDNEEADYHVQTFLDNAGFLPDAISFLLTCPDILHLHDGMERETVLTPDLCARGGRAFNAERERQPWTNWQFRGLVQLLQERGIKVYLSTMDSFNTAVDGRRHPSEWCAGHSELWAKRYAGEVVRCLSPLKRFSDGTFYEDFLVAKLREVIADYGFDGFHAADGMGGPRRPLWVADYTDDMVGQFVEMMGLEGQFSGNEDGGAGPPLSCDGDRDLSERRAQYIWADLRREWCTFYARRLEGFMTKVCDALHAMGKKVVANNVWTQDPFQAFYRYGVDYRGLVRAGVDAFLLETVGAGNEIGAEGIPVELRAEMNQTVLFTRCCLPQTQLLCLNGTGDSTENWDVLNHAPPVCEREHYTLGSLFLQDRDGFRHASDGPFVCLADGINCHQWRWMAHNWQVGYEKLPTKVLGATIVWSEAALDAEFDDYLAHRTLPRHAVCSELMRRGAPLLSILNIDDLAAARGCLFVPRPELLPEPEWQRVFAYDGGPVVTITRDDPGQLTCSVYNRGEQERAFSTPLSEQLPDEMPEPPNYLYGIYSQPVDETFLQACAELLVELSDSPVVINEVDDARILAYETAPGRLRLLIGNEAHYYIIPQVDLNREIVEVTAASHFPRKPIEPEGSTLTTRVPPRGMVVLDVEFATADCL